MSTTIDQRVVEMRFDNKQFESNVSTTMSTLDKLKRSLNLTGASKGLEEVNSAAKKCDMSTLGSAVETVKTKFSALEVMGITALANITNSAVNAGKRIVSALTIDPVKAGFSEYETQINAVQTILANTESKGKTLDDVNGALDELNTYADKTIYNFTEMTRNIGTFTAAGVDLDTSVSAIKGIANLAAVSGSTSQQASTAMYQLSQALASGTVKLMDWNSVVNAGMGGQIFQDALKETAKVHGIAIDDIIKKNGSFRESLQEGWLTSEILTETLSKFTGDLSEEQLKSMGYTEKQIEEIMKLGETANNAATKVKTFSQLFDTLKEAAQSGWTQTWEILVGDFEEAKELLTKVSDTIGAIIGKSAESRNELLENWKVLGGRDDLIESFKNVYEGLKSVITPIKEAFRDIFPPMTAEKLVGFTEGLKNLTSKFKLSETASDNLKRTFKGLFAIVDIVKQVFVAVVKAGSSLFGTVGDLGGGILGLTAKFGDGIVAFADFIRSSDILNKVFQGIADVIKAAFNGISSFVGFIKTKFIAPGWEVFKALLENIQGSMSGVGEAATGMKGLVISAFDSISSALESCSFVKILQGMWNIIKTIGAGIAKVFGGLMNGLVDALGNADSNGILGIMNSLITGGLLTGIIKFIKDFADPLNEIKDSIGGFLGGLTDILDGVRGCLEGYQSKLKADALMKIAGAIALLTAALIVLSFIDTEKLFVATGAIAALFGELIIAMSLLSRISGVKGMLGLSVGIMSLANAMLVLSIAMKIISTISMDELKVGLIGIAGGLLALVVAVNFLPEAKVKSAASAIKKMSSALLILSLAMKIMSTMSWEEVGIGLATTVGGLAALVIAANLLPKDMALRSLGIMSLATAMLILSGALKIMSTMSWDEIGRGLTTLAGSMAVLVISMNLMKRALPGAAAMLIIAPALVVLAGALKIMGGMSLDKIGRSMLTLGGAMAIFAVGLNLMRKAIPGATALLVASSALAVLTPILLILGTMSWESIAKGLVTIAGAFIIIGVAGKVLSPILPAILGLATAMALIGAGTLAAGLGLMALGTGLSMLAVGFTAIVASLGAIVTGIVGIVKAFIVGIGEGIIAVCKVIAKGAPAIGEAIKAVVIACCDVLVECTPMLADTLLKLVVGLLNSLAEYTPQIVDSLAKFIVGLLNGLADNVPDFIQALVNIFVSVFQGAVDALSSIDPGSLIQGIAAIGLMAGVVAALAAISTMIPQAMAGAVGMGVVVAELGMVLAALGALSQIPGLEWLISEGGQLLRTIGTAIGQFIGGIAGGIALGATDTLPEVGTNLASFMTNLQPFIDGAKLIDESVVTGVKSLVGIMLAVTGANLLESITSWVTGGSSVSQFATDIVVLGQGLKGFSDSVAGVSAENVTAAANAAKALADMTAVIPNEGGVVSWFVGENSISKFAEELPTLGQGLKGFSDSVAGIMPENIISAANAAKSLADMTSVIPNEGGIKSWFAGESSISKFATEIVTLGMGLKGFSDAVTGIVIENVTSGANAAKSLAEMTAVIPNEGGIVAWFSGESSISKFAGQLPLLGQGLKGFSDAVTGIVPESVIAASNAAKTLAEMTSVIPNEGGVVSWFTGENSLSKFAGDIMMLGMGLKGFSDATIGIDPEATVAAANSAKSLAEMTSHIPNEGGVVSWFTGESSIANFADKLPVLGAGLKGFSESAAGINPETLTASANAAQALAEMTSHIPKEGGIKAWFTGETNVANFADKLPTLGKGLKGFSDSVAGISPENVTAAANAAKSLAQMTETVPTETDKIITFGDNLKTFGSRLASYFEKTKGISAESVSSSTKAIDAVKQATSVESSKLSSLATAIDDAAEALLNLSKIPSDCASKFTSALQDLGETSTEAFVKAFDGLDANLKKQAQKAMDAFVEGIEGAKSKVKSALSDIVSACVEAISNKSSSFETAGKNLARGLANGISANSYLAEAKAKAMAKAAAQAAKKALDINSPSKVFRKIGTSIPEGFAMGIDKLSGLVKNSATSMATNSIDGVRSSISHMADIINSDIDAQPTIRPVLDLSDIRSGAGTISSMLGLGSSIGIMSNVNAVSSMMSQRNQNGANDIVSEIAKLNKNLGKVGNTTYSINGITYDDGSNISDAVKSIVRAVRMDRRM